ncbi:MAG: RsmB/NOP family class I SAM-dependent RNA methyltransferase [Puniceicoccaceae bacterium]
MNDNSFSRNGQDLARRWMARYLAAPAKVSDIRAPEDGPASDSAEERRARRLHSAAIRNLRLHRHILDALLKRPPKREVLAVLHLALAELDLDARGKQPAIIDSWVGAARRAGGAPAAGLANAVLRKAAARLAQARSGSAGLSPALLHSHPDWLVGRWRRDRGEAETLRLLAWNQGVPATFASVAPGAPVPAGLAPARWRGFHRLEGGIPPPVRAAIAAGALTIRDPATRIAVSLLAAERPRSVLDLCASPGGKSRALLSDPAGPGILTAADLPGRLGRLSENLAPWKERAAVAPVDLTDPGSFPAGWAGAFDGVLLDAPCSNTGVLRRKPDAKWRLQPSDLERLPAMQSAFLRRAAGFVRPGGVLVYSTCSLEPDENRAVADAFLASPEGRDFHLTAALGTLPTRTGHDGAGAFRFRRSGKAPAPPPL